MEKKIVLLDTSILIDYYRRTDKEKSIWIKLVRSGYSFAVSTITKYEIYTGATLAQLNFWSEIFEQIAILPYDETCVNASIKINAQLKRKRKQINVADLFIASTAVANQYQFATLNKNHFERI